MTDFIDEKRQEITNRLLELKPLVDEYTRLEAAAAALADVDVEPPEGGTPRRRGPRRPRSSSGRAEAGGAATAARHGPSAGTRLVGKRRKGAGTRAAAALSLVEEYPGITIPELAARMGIKQNYLYKVMPSLEEGGRVKKEGRDWHPRK